MLIISKEPQTNIPNPTDAIAFKKIINEKSLILGQADYLDPDLLADAGYLVDDFPDPGHGDGQALHEVGLNTHL